MDLVEHGLMDLVERGLMNQDAESGSVGELIGGSGE